jgi:hypothetical protein
VAPQVLEYDPWDLPFAREYCIDFLFPNIDKYKEKLAEYQGKDPRSIKILNKDEGKKDQENERAIKHVV